MDACDENPAGIAHCWHTGNDPKKGLYKFCCWCGQRAYVNPQDPPGHGKFLEENTK